MYDKYYFITFTLFSGMLLGFEFKMIIPEPDPIRISCLTFRSEPDPFVTIGLGYRVFGTIYNPTYDPFIWCMMVSKLLHIIVSLNIMNFNDVFC